MKARLLESHEQFSPGADLWVFSDVQNSKALKKADWYLNYLVFNSRFKSSNKPTLIGAKGKLPTRFVLSLPYTGNVISWAESIKNIYHNLGIQSIRIFLPNSFNNPNQAPLDFEIPTSVVIE